nr:pyruvate formate lyase family protein [uncultured Merdimonas sp.]
MYWKEHYTTRTAESYEGYDTIYNNEPRLNFSELLDHMETFTQVYQSCKNDPPAIREAKCFDAQYPQMLLGIMPNDLFCGRADIFPLGMNAQYINSEWGFVMNFQWFEEKIQDPEVTEEDKERLEKLRDFWSDHTSTRRFLAEMDPEDRVYMVTGGVTDGRTLDLEGQPHAASALQRVAGIFLDYEKLLSLGLPGLHSLIDEKEKQHPENDANFYEGIRMSLRTVEKVLLWYAGQARELAGREENPSRRADLEEMERICRKLVHEKPETFREAIQLVILYTLLDGAREWGRMDDYLGPYYVRDLQKGILDEEEAIRLLTSFWRLMIVKEQVTDDRVIIGGLGRKHPEEADQLAMVIMEVSRRVRDIVPQLTLRMYEGMDPALYQKAMDCLGEGTTYPMLYQDENIIPGIQKVFGVSYEEAKRWMPLGCGEFTIDHRIIASPNSILNLPNVLWGTINGGYDATDQYRLTPNTTTLADYDSFEDLWQAYCSNIEFLSDVSARNHSRGYAIIAGDMSLNLHNLLYDGCLDAGKSVISGGTVKCGGSDEIYGLVTCSDSLYAIKTCVYEEKKISKETLLAALKADFSGYEEIRAMLLDVDKFGNDLEGPDNMMQAVHEQVSFATMELSGKYFGLDCFGMVNINNRDNTTHGRNTGATADGRHAGVYLSNANNPTSGMDKNGVTAFINSLLKARNDIHFGVVQNMKFSKDTFNRMRDTVILPVMDSYFGRGGTQAMISVVGREDLENARKEPEKYANLIVRVGGFSARYVELADDVQLDILNRTLN